MNARKMVSVIALAAIAIMVAEQAHAHPGYEQSMPSLSQKQDALTAIKNRQTTMGSDPHKDAAWTTPKHVEVPAKQPDHSAGHAVGQVLAKSVLKTLDAQSVLQNAKDMQDYQRAREVQLRVYSAEIHKSVPMGGGGVRPSNREQ
jgi:hypothetical protein